MTDEPTLPDFDQLWDYASPAETAQAFRRVLPLAEAAGDAGYLAELLTQLARTHSLRGQFAEAHALLDRVAGMQAAVSATAWARYLLERGRTHNSAGERETAVALFAAALAAAQAAGADAHAADALHMLAIASPPAQQIAWARRGLALAESTRDPRAARWAGPLYNNLGWSLHDLGRYAEALAAFEAGLAWREAHSQDEPRTIRIARWSVGRALRSLGRLTAALALQRALLAEYAAVGEADGFVHEEIAECLLALGDAAAARPHFAAVHRLLAPLGWVEADRLARLAALAAEDAA